MGNYLKFLIFSYLSISTTYCFPDSRNLNTGDELIKSSNLEPPEAVIVQHTTPLYGITNTPLPPLHDSQTFSFDPISKSLAEVKPSDLQTSINNENPESPKLPNIVVNVPRNVTVNTPPPPRSLTQIMSGDAQPLTNPKNSESSELYETKTLSYEFVYDPVSKSLTQIKSSDTQTLINPEDPESPKPPNILINIPHDMILTTLSSPLNDTKKSVNDSVSLTEMMFGNSQRSINPENSESSKPSNTSTSPEHNSITFEYEFVYDPVSKTWVETKSSDPQS